MIEQETLDKMIEESEPDTGKIFFCSQDNGFYPESLKEDYIKAGTWPDESKLVELSDEQMELFSKPNDSASLTIRADENGNPAWLPPELPPLELRIDAGRDWRDDMLVKIVDELTKPLRIKELTESQLDELDIYRRLLMDFPEKPGFPDCIAPAVPSWCYEKLKKTAVDFEYPWRPI